jgi:alpha-L-fucosidase
VDVGPHRDLAGDLLKAVRAEGLKMGFYYSLYEWKNPLYLSDVDAYVEIHMLPQMKDLVTRYEPDILWTDGEWDHPAERWRAPEFLAWLFGESPVGDTVAVNDRWGKETRGKHGGYYTTEYGLVHADEAEEVIPHPWEECRGIGYSFGYNRAETLADYSTPEELIEILVDTVARGGNLLLDIGPTADGRIPVIMEERLLQMGQWLATNGEAIYGTRKWREHAEGDAIRYTAKDGVVYATVLGWPGRTVTLKTPKSSRATKVRLLGSDETVGFEGSGDGLRITMPESVVGGEYAYTFELTGVE